MHDKNRNLTLFQASKTVPDGHVPGQIGMIRRVVLNKDAEHGLGLAVIGTNLDFVNFFKIFYRWEATWRSNSRLRRLPKSARRPIWPSVCRRCHSQC